MAGLGTALAEAGGATAPAEHAARLRGLLLAELERGAAELARSRSGYEEPVLVAFADLGPPGNEGLVAALPVAAALRADADAARERAWLLSAAVVGALHEATTSTAAPLAPALRAGDLGGWLVLGMAAQAGARPRPGDPELAVLALAEALAGIDRLRGEGLVLPGHVLAGHVGPLRAPVGPAHPLRVAEAVARLGGRPVDPDSVAALEDRVLELLGDRRRTARPHDDPDPSRRVARRIVQRLDGMGKWGGYHTEFAHLARGFAGHERALADAVGEALLAAGLLEEKPSTGQRHVFLNPRRAGDIRRLIDDGELPPGLVLPAATGGEVAKYRR